MPGSSARNRCTCASVRAPMQGDPDVAVRQHTHRGQYVTGTQRLRRAGRSRGHRETAPVQRVQECLAVHVQTGEGHQVRQPMHRIADHLDVGDGGAPPGSGSGPPAPRVAPPQRPPRPPPPAATPRRPRSAAARPAPARARPARNAPRCALPAGPPRAGHPTCARWPSTPRTPRVRAPGRPTAPRPRSAVRRPSRTPAPRPRPAAPYPPRDSRSSGRPRRPRAGPPRW